MPGRKPMTPERARRWFGENRERARERNAIKLGYAPPPPEWMCPPCPPLGSPCPECGAVPMRKGKPARLDIHHNHITGAFEGWMCHACNMAPHRTTKN
jgi:hypothetical protein